MDVSAISGMTTSRLKSMSLDSGAEQSTRLTAVVTLAERGSAAALDGLRAALVEANDEVVKQRAIERLGKVGVAGDVDVLRTVRTGNATTQRVLRTAKCFLSYRHRLDTYRFDEPKQRLPATSASAGPITTGAATKKMRSRLELLPPPVLGVALVPDPARRFDCGPNEFALMLNRDIVERGPSTIADRQALPAVIVRYNEETGAYDPAYYLLTDPIRGGRFRIAGRRGSGNAGLFGTGAVEADTIRFEVNATELPLDHPLTVSGSYDIATGTVRIEQAIIEPRFSERQAQQRKQPRLVTRPDSM